MNRCWICAWFCVVVGAGTTRAEETKPVAAFPHPEAVRVVSISPDGKYLLTGGDEKNARLWDATTGKALGVHELTHKSRITFVAFSPDSATAWSGSSDLKMARWGSGNGRPVGSVLPVPFAINQFIYSPSGKQIVCAGGSGVAILDAVEGVAMMRSTGKLLNPMSVGVRGKVVLLEQKSANIWDVGEGLMQKVAMPERGDILSADLSPDDGTLLTGFREGAVRVWDVKSGRQVGAALEHNAPVSTLLWIDEGKSFITCCGSPDGKGNAQWWDGESLKPMGAGVELRGSVVQMLLSPDAKMLLILTQVNKEKGEIRLCATANGKPLLETIVHEGPLYSAVFHPDGKSFFTAGGKEARQWKIHEGK